jgi:hypothetical protein
MKKDFVLELLYGFSRSWSAASDDGIEFLILRSTNIFSRFRAAALGGGVPAPGKQKAAMAGRPEANKPRRGVLRDIGNFGNVRVPEG